MDRRIWGPPSPNKRALHNLIISRTLPGTNEVLALYKILIDDERPVIALLEESPENHHFRAALIANPDEMLPKLCYFLKFLRVNVMPKNAPSGSTKGMLGPTNANSAIKIPAAFTKEFILVLAKEPSRAFDVSSAGYFDLILSVLDLYLSLAGFATVSLAPLKDLISTILEMPRSVCVIEEIVSEPAGAALLADLLENKSLIHQVFTEASLCLFGGRLARLIDDCIASHGADIDNVVLVWKKMEEIHSSMEEQVGRIEAGERNAVGRAPIFLGEDEKELLGLARISVPYNVTTARYAVQGLLERHKDQIRLMLSSFPCSTCKARLYGVLKTRPRDSIGGESKREFDDINAPLGVFPIYLSDTAMWDLKCARVDGTLSKILATIQKLADGMWEFDTELSVPTGDKSKLRGEPIPRAARWCEDGYILWERGVGRVEENKEEWVQIVKIVRVGSRADMKAAISAARKAQRSYTREYRIAAGVCVRNPGGSGGLVPKRFVGADAVGLEVNGAAGFESSSPKKKLAPSDALVLHKILCTGKQYSFTKRVAEMILQGGHQAEVPFVVSPEEESIINYFDSSVCILGRSGTGKTTCLVFRLLATYIRDRLSNDDKQVRQIFLTRSPVLAGKIRQYVNRLIDSQCLNFAIEDAGDGDDEGDAGGFNAVLDEDEISAGGLLEAGGKDWPMVCTFDSFASMLERSFRFAQRNLFEEDEGEASRLDFMNRRVDFGKFKRIYWPKLGRKGLPVDGVFSEIMGVIKGTSSAFGHQPLSEAQFQELAHRAAPNFRPGPEREAVYELYKAYEKRKGSFDEWDDLDRISKLHELLAKDEKLSSRLRSQITEVYVDEIQDQRLSEIELLLNLVDDAKSFAFAGDTAQCISRDSRFRFQDLKSLFFRKHERLGVLAGWRDLAKLKLFTLSKNYRTHDGILKLAAKVVDVLYTTFPYAIDKFSPELGDFDGPAPIVFSGFSPERIFRPREAESTTTISEFGAEQVLIVRDEDAKSLLAETMEDEVLILTILESKGMEFQDVFLFDFFSGSGCQAAFRALANSQVVGGRVDDGKYPELCIELKNLYVAITRSREMLYIIESDSGAAQPIRDMWGPESENPIVDFVASDDPTLQTRLDEIRKGQSNKEEWGLKGNEFFNQRMYEQAMYCYRRAGKNKLVNMCQASIEERNGRDVISDPSCWDIARGHYLEAARLFRSCEKYDRALKCYESIKEYSIAAELCEGLSKIPEKAHESYTRRAADFYMLAKKELKAIPLYEKLGLHELAISGYRKLDYVKELITYLKKYRDKMDEKVYNRNARIIALTIVSSNSASNDLRKPAISLLSEQEQEQLYTQFKFYDELKKLYISQNRLVEAMELSYAEGSWKDLRQLMKQAESNPDFDQESLTTNGEQFTERVLFDELSTSLVDTVQRANAGPLKKGLSVRKSTSYPQTSKLFEDTSNILNKKVFNRDGNEVGESSEILTGALTLADLMILQTFTSEKEKLASPFRPMGGLMGDIIIRCAQRLLNLYRSRVLVDVGVLRLFFQVIPGGNSDGYDVVSSSPICQGSGYGSQRISGDELVDGIIRILKEWVVKGYTRYVNQRDEEYGASSANICRHYVLRGWFSSTYNFHRSTGHKANHIVGWMSSGTCIGECQFGHQKRVIPKEEMIESLEFSWSMSLITSYFKYLDRNGALGGNMPDGIIKRQGHIWWTRVFESVVVISDLLQSPSAKLFLLEKRSSGFKFLGPRDSGNRDSIDRGKGLMILGCLDDFEWRLRARIRKLASPDFWNLLDILERAVASNLRSEYAQQMWRDHLNRIEPWGISAMQLLNGVEGCLREPSGTINAMWSFAQGFKASISQAKEFYVYDIHGREPYVHHLLNRLDRVMAIVVYISSSSDFVLKQSQIELLQNSRCLNLNADRNCNAAATDVLNRMVDIYSLIRERMDSNRGVPAWYREAINRRIEESSVIAILNSKFLGTMDFFLRASKSTRFWTSRRGNPQALWGVPPRIDQFPGWIINHIDIVQSPTDPIIFSHLSLKNQITNRFRGYPVPTVLFQRTRPVETPSQSRAAAGYQTANAEDAIDTLEMTESLPNEKLSINIKDVETIQRRWRVISSVLRDRRYLAQNPAHRRITQILKSLFLPPNLDSDLFRKCFRMVGFVLLELVMDIKLELGAITAKLGYVGRTRNSMETMERVLSGTELVRDHNGQLAEVERSIEPSSLASIVGERSIITEMFGVIRKAQGLQKTVSSTAADLNGWIQSWERHSRV
ncbi:hypothetical protein TWF191_008426 [Orbilia oligospora]|uniref:UvrD-like helicase ATP-binding domain-containing protein n=1 Tax=Orbilia oligospora TaxID=2813651 RepID=A0A7C8UP58_ORBOL|nr:hypothetical protein TWF191_008426 [Orbilia oligospora]